VISAQVTEEDKIRGLEAGADAYLMKPFNSEELVVRVRKLIERQRLLKQKFEEVAGQTEVSVESLPRKDRAFMTHLLDVVYRLMASGNVDIESVAKEMAMSRSQLNRRMLAITNQNSSTYIMQLRLARAKRLLKADVNMAIGDVAQRCGFDDVAYFSRIFKQTFDITPSQYRKQI
jgi:AraC-like DNA-binding protein